MRLKDADDPELAWCRDVIERQADQLTRLVDDLLDVSRITQGKIKLRIEPVDLADRRRGRGRDQPAAHRRAPARAAS